MEEKKIKKKIIIGALVAVILLIIAGIAIFALKKEDSYRIVKVYELEGTATVTRTDIGDLEVYNNMVLESGDKIYLSSGTMTLKLDEDKYVYVEEGAKFELIATGSDENSKTTINLTQGAIMNDIQNPLGDEASYEVNTPNSHMSVRGTTFRVYVYEEDGVLYTRNTVFEGIVASRLRYKDGTYSVDVVSVPGGKEVLIYEDDNTTDYVSDVVDIDYDTLPETVKEKVKEILGEESIPEEVEEESSEEETGPFTVNFMYNGTLFGSQTIEKGEFAQIPKLKPAETGAWEFDFTTPIMEDTDIIWK